MYKKDILYSINIICDLYHAQSINDWRCRVTNQRIGSTAGI